MASARASSEASRSPAPAGPDGMPTATVPEDLGQQENAPTAAILDSFAATAKHTSQEKTTARRGTRKARHRKQIKAQSPRTRGLSSASSFSSPMSPAHVLSAGTQLATTADLPNNMPSTLSPSSAQTEATSLAVATLMADEKKGDVQQDQAVSVPQPVAGAAVDPQCKLPEAGPVPSMRATDLKTAAPAPPPRKHSARQRAPLPNPDVLKALATFSPSPDKGRARKESAKSFKSLGQGAAEPLSFSQPQDQTVGSAVRPRVTLWFVAKVVVPVLLVMTLLAFIFLYQKPKLHTETYCTTKCCDEHRYRISNQLDKKADPCDDFGAHVCGRWTPSKELSLSRSQMSDLLLSWQYKFQEILDKAFAHFRVAKKVAAMFHSCLRQNHSQVHIMKEFMRARGIPWPERPETPVPPAKALFDLSLNWNVHLWFGLKILPAVLKEEPRRILFQSNQRMALWKAMFSQIPKKYLDKLYTDIFKIFSDKANTQPSGKEMSNTYDMLEFVFDTLVPTCPCTARIPGLFTLNATNWLPRSIGRHVVSMLNEATGIDPPFTLNDFALVDDASQFRNILELLKLFSDETLSRHLSWLFVQAYGAVAYPTAMLLLIHGSERRAQERRPRFCAGHVESSYKLLVAAMASVGLFTEDERRRISDHMARIVEVAAEKTLASSWLDNQTSRIAAEKLKSVRTALWPSEKFLNEDVLKNVYANFSNSSPSFTQFWIDTRQSQHQLLGTEAAEEELRLGDNTQLPYMDYNHVLNQLSVSLGALAPPFYCKEATNGMLYGGLLYLYARSLISAIDSEGVEINPQGDIVGSWLSESIQDTFDQRTLHCLPGNISIFPEVPAMEIAYAAFKRHAEEDNTRLSEEWTEDKVFFITACLASCATTPADNLFGGDCNKAVMNFAPFAKAFDCPVGSKMNPASKCTFYD